MTVDNRNNLSYCYPNLRPCWWSWISVLSAACCSHTWLTTLWCKERIAESVRHCEPVW